MTLDEWRLHAYSRIMELDFFLGVTGRAYQEFGTDMTALSTWGMWVIPGDELGVLFNENVLVLD